MQRQSPLHWKWTKVSQTERPIEEEGITTTWNCARCVCVCLFVWVCLCLCLSSGWPCSSVSTNDGNKWRLQLLSRHHHYCTLTAQPSDSQRKKTRRPLNRDDELLPLFRLHSVCSICSRVTAITSFAVYYLSCRVLSPQLPLQQQPRTAHHFDDCIRDPDYLLLLLFLAPLFSPLTACIYAQMTLTSGDSSFVRADTLWLLLLLLQAPDRLFNSFLPHLLLSLQTIPCMSPPALHWLLFGFVCFNYLLFALIFPFTTNGSCCCYRVAVVTFSVSTFAAMETFSLGRSYSARGWPPNTHSQAHNKLNHLERISDCAQCNWHYSLLSFRAVALLLPVVFTLLSVELGYSRINWRALWCTQVNTHSTTTDFQFNWTLSSPPHSLASNYLPIQVKLRCGVCACVCCSIVKQGTSWGLWWCYRRCTSSLDLIFRHVTKSVHSVSSRQLAVLSRQMNRRPYLMTCSQWVTIMPD